MSDVRLFLGDCLEIMKTLPENSVDAVVTDPPYGLEFMGQDWDHGIPGEPFWTAALRVAKPGCIMLAFGGTRTFHRLACAIEDAGWEIRDTVMWVYGSGFPKSLDISKAIDKAAGAEREVVGQKDVTCGTGDAFGKAVGTGNKGTVVDITAPATASARLWDGWGTALKPAWEPIIVAMKPRDGTFAQNAEKWGVAGINVDGCRVGTEVVTTQGGDKFKGNGIYGKYATCEETQHAGRWPANLIHDGSDEVVEGFPVTGGGGPSTDPHRNTFWGFNGRPGHKQTDPDKHAGSAARFFYCAKVSRAERELGLEGMEEHVPAAIYGDGMNGPTRFDPALHTPEGMANRVSHSIANHHPTVKPLSLMRYLVRLTKTPTGGLVLDPFMGSGTTGMACVVEGRDFIGIELSAEYLAIAKRRIAEAQMQLRMPLEVR